MCEVCHSRYFLKQSDIEKIPLSETYNEEVKDGLVSDGIVLVSKSSNSSSNSENSGNSNSENSNSNDPTSNLIFVPKDVTPKPQIVVSTSKANDSSNSASANSNVSSSNTSTSILCLACPKNCLKCTSELSCSQCEEGYYFDTALNACKACDISCAACLGPKEHHCLRCRSGAYLGANGQCFECESSCGSCDGEAHNCSTCSDQFAFVNSSGHCHSNTLKAMVYIQQVNGYVPCSGCTKCMVDYKPVCKLCPSCASEAEVTVSMYQINPPIIQIDFSVDSLRTFNADQYLKIRSKDEREEYKFEIIDNIEGTLWIRIYLDQVQKSVSAKMFDSSFYRVLEMEKEEMQISGFNYGGRNNFILKIRSNLKYILIIKI